ncbi:MAG: hypothetical protein WC810_14385 [Janthinobacterium sp.]|jgi:hypothetical protein
MSTLIDRIETEMQTDDANREKESKKIKYWYSKSSLDEKELIDNIFIAMCGWTLQTLITE